MGLFIIFWILPLLLFDAAAQSHNCPEKYLRFSQNHTFCKPKNSSCDILMKGVSNEEKQEILKIHNDVRSETASGITGMPTASNMLEMIWDSELAAIAQKHVETCQYGNDCKECRMTPSFKVGQNAAMKIIYGICPTGADWNWFLRNIKGQQITWADTWAVGCGFAMYNDKDLIKSYYVCNYGPAGNIAGWPAYEEGPVCSKCPKNTCCDGSCRKHGITPKYAGLCKIINEKKPPGENREVDDIFFCNFQGQKDCMIYITGPVPWNIFSTKAGNYAGITLSGGQNTTLKFASSIKTDNGELCVSLYYRRMPALAGDEFANTGFTIFDTGSSSPMIFSLKPFPKRFWHDFSLNKYSLVIPKKSSVTVSLNFSVPPGKPRQTLEIKRVLAKEGRCK